MELTENVFLKKFKRLSAINEAAIKPVEDQDDKFPVNIMKEVDDPANSEEIKSNQPSKSPEQSQNIEKEQSPEAEMDQKIASGEVDPNANALADSNASATTAPENGPVQSEIPQQTEQPPAPEMNVPQQSPEQVEQDIQNELLHIQLSAMRKMSEKISEIESTLAGLSSNVSSLRTEVEKVREPEPVEKLEKKWQDSYPFKYTLNDLWKGNVFQGRTDLFNDPDIQTDQPINGVKKTSEGEYVAQYDQLPKMTDNDVKKSFEIY